MNEASAAWRRKVDPRLLAQLHGPTPNDAAQVQVFVQVRSGSEGWEDAGLVAGPASGLLSGTIALSSIPELASRPDLVFIELARPLGFDPADSERG